ncbi:MAG: hypothetical protein ABIO70_05180 [Pseudomonadota bacterium]
MSTDPSTPRDPREVQTFSMPERPAPPPEEPSEHRKRKSSANAWVILFFLLALGGVVGFWQLYWGPKTEADNAAAAAAAAYVRPWSERAEESIHLTFEGAAGTNLATTIVEALAPGAQGANLDGMALTRAEPNLECLFTVSWKDEKGQPTGAQVRWVISDRKPLEASLVVPEGGAPVTEDQRKALINVLNSQAFPVVRRNIAEK